MTAFRKKSTWWKSCLLLAMGATFCIAQDDTQTSSDDFLDMFSDPSQDEAAADLPIQESPNELFPDDSSMAPPIDAPSIQIHYVVERPIVETVQQGGKVVQITRHV